MESPKFEKPTNLEEEHTLTLERSKYMLEHIAHQDEQISTDPLTGLKNRRFFEKELDRALNVIGTRRKEGEHRAGGEPLKELSLLFIDLDNFKQVNDTKGHLEGDGVLKEVAKVLISSVREADIVARFGGDEFYILLPRANERDAVVIANKILTNLKKNDSKLNELNITASIGVCFVDASNVVDSKTLINHADAAAYMAKNNGKDCVEVYTGV